MSVCKDRVNADSYNSPRAFRPTHRVTSNIRLPDLHAANSSESVYTVVEKISHLHLYDRYASPFCENYIPCAVPLQFTSSYCPYCNSIAYNIQINATAIIFKEKVNHVYLLKLIKVIDERIKNLYTSICINNKFEGIKNTFCGY